MKEPVNDYPLNPPYPRAIICKELVELVGCMKEAAVLRQFLYWLPRTRDIDNYLREEAQRIQESGEGEPLIKPTNGWVYKTSEELARETMVGSGRSARRYTQSLVEKGYLWERENPNHKWDRTLQYRVNIRRLEADLNELGFSLQTVMGSEFAAILPILQLVDSRQQLVDSKRRDDAAIPETTAETTGKTTLDSGTASDSDSLRSSPSSAVPEAQASEGRPQQKETVGANYRGLFGKPVTSQSSNGPEEDANHRKDVGARNRTKEATPNGAGQKEKKAARPENGEAHGGDSGAWQTVEAEPVDDHEKRSLMDHAPGDLAAWVKDEDRRPIQDFCLWVVFRDTFNVPDTKAAKDEWIGKWSKVRDRIGRAFPSLCAVQSLIHIWQRITEHDNFELTGHAEADASIPPRVFQYTQKAITRKIEADEKPNAAQRAVQTAHEARAEVEALRRGA